MHSKNQKNQEASALFRPIYKKGLAVFGTSGLVLGLGMTGNNSAAAVNAPFACTSENTLTAAGTSEEDKSRNVADLNTMITDVGEICLRGDFFLNAKIEFTRDVHFYGDGIASIQHLEGTVFEAEVRQDITLENLTIRNSTQNSAVVGANITIINSNLTGNSGGAVLATGNVDITNSVITDSAGENGAAIQAVSYGETMSVVNISNSTFSLNENESENDGDPNAYGGAIWAYGSVIISNSTFVDNTANFGGAVYVVPDFNSGDLRVTNSTFVRNTATGNGAEGGALFARSGQVLFSTFLDNTGPTPVPGEEIPGNAIYKHGPETLSVGGNIFAGSSPDPQLGYGEIIFSPFSDLGGNLFTTSSDKETDITQDDSSVFGVTIASIFGTPTPALATYAPNSSGTQTLGLTLGSTASNIVPSGLPFSAVTLDQRGATRSHPADAGAFEGVIPSVPTPTPSQTPATATPPTATPPALANTGTDNTFLLGLSSAGLIALGAFALAFRSRLKRNKD
ncbi:MAG: hypothetical protein RLZZ41_228 [Actinomycetota bacterium]|jgi:hypothetical protein